jgi:hypothetical protein
MRCVDTRVSFGAQLSSDSPWARQCLQDALLIGTTTKSLEEIRSFNSQQVRGAGETVSEWSWRVGGAWWSLHTCRAYRRNCLCSVS